MTRAFYVVHFKSDNESFLFEDSELIEASLKLSYSNTSVVPVIEWDTPRFGQIYEIRRSNLPNDRKVEIGTITLLPVLEERTHF